MNSNVKKALMVGGVVIVGYFLWKKYGNKVGLPSLSKGKGESNFTEMDSIMDAAASDFSGSRTGRRASGITTCGDGCDNGVCYVPQYDQEGNIVSYLKARCGGSAGSGTLNKRK